MVKTSENGENEQSKIWTDPRFSHLVSDPRFKSLPRRERKVKIDKRFESMFHDEKFKVKYTVDKYGRKVNKTSSEDLKKYYELDSSDEEGEEKERKLEEKVIAKEDAASDEASSNDELGDDGELLPPPIKEKLLDSEFDYARGEGRLMTDSSSDEESSDEDEEVFIEHVWGELDNDAPKTDESTRRLAACNMDWDRIRASDILVLCNSFLPTGGSIVSVTIYPSEFGKERMAEEERYGPQELVDKDSESDEDLVKEQDSDAEEGDDYHMEKLRQYQLNRLKYYYAVIECDSVATADKLYAECDGLEYESTATKLDLRFIPDDVTFDDDEPKEVCTEVPDLTKYKPRIFATSALYQAKVDLTWDETEIERKELNEKIAAGKLHEISDADLRKYVACSSEDEDEEDEDLGQIAGNAAADDKEATRKPRDEIAMYKSLLEDINKKEQESKKGKFEMEYTWGINVESKPKEDKEVKKNLTPIEKALEKKREKNKRRKDERKKKKGTGDEDYSSDDLPDGIDMNDPYFAEEFANGDFEPSKQTKNKKKSKGIKDKAEDNSEDDEKKARELELLLDDGEDDKQHFSLEKIQKEENETKSKKKRRKKLKKSKQEIEATKAPVEDNFEVNVEDSRFKALYTSHLFNIDPTDSHFKKTKGMEKIIHEKQKRRHSKPEKSAEEKDLDEELSEKRPKPNLENRLLIKNLKRKIHGNKA